MSPEESSKRQEGLSAWWAVREVDSLFARIGRYTRFVVYGKWSLLVVALVLMTSLIVWPLATKDSSGLRVSFTENKASQSAPSSPVMQSPVYSGSGVSGQQYKITGKTATQQSASLIVIDAVEAAMTRPDGSLRILTADKAEFQQDKKLLELYGNVTVIDADGTNFVTEQATIETNTSRIYGTKRITGQGNMGNLVASGFEITDNGEHIRFTGGNAPVKLMIQQAAPNE